MRSQLRFLALTGSAVVFAAGVVAEVACSSDHPACNQDPWQCVAGQTCWPNACVCSGSQDCTPVNCTPQFACVQSDQGKQQGDPCALSIGQATCGDQQTCVSFVDAGGGSCRSYCDPNGNHGCPDGQQCVSIAVGNSVPPQTENVCVPNGALVSDSGLVVDTDALVGDGGAPGDNELAYDGNTHRQ